MRRLGSFTPRLRFGLCLALIAGASYLASLALVTGADAKAQSPPKGAKDSTTETPAAKKPAKKKLTGQELYAIHCNRCHPERYPTEFTAAQWKTIMLEMRTRANLPAAQAKAILKYLQQDSGTP